MSKTGTRIIAVLLAVITTVSMFSTVVISASANTTPTATESKKKVEKNDKKDIEDLDEDDDEKLFYLLGEEGEEGGAEFETDGQYWKDAAGEVIYEMIYRCIDHLAEDSWVGAVFSMGGLVIFKSIYDAINPKSTEPSPDTQLILDAIEKLSEKVSANHDEAMKAFKKIDLNISTQSFRASVDELHDTTEQVLDSLQQYKIKTNTEKKGVITKSEYTAYKNALSNSELDFSKLEKKFTSFNNFLTGKKYQDDKTPGYIAYADYVLAKVNEKNSSHTFTKVADLKTASKGIRKDIKNMQEIAIVYSGVLATMAHLQYKIDEYEQAETQKNAKTAEEKEHAADLKDQMTNTRDQRLKQIKDKTDTARKYYKKAISYVNKAGVAILSISGVKKSFPTFGDAWATGFNSSKKFTITLIKDVTADAARGLNDAGLGKNFGFNDDGGLISKDGYEATIDLNKHKIDCTRKAFSVVYLELGSNITLKNGTIKNASRITSLDNTSKDSKAIVNIDNLKMQGCRNTALYFKCYQDTTLNLNNSEISDTAKGSAINVGWHLKYNIANTTFKNNNGEYGGAMRGQYATDGSYLKNCTFIGNEADKSGGALYSVYNVSDSTFKNNKANGGKGGAFYGWGSVTNCSFDGNSATDLGGAVYVQKDVSGCTFKNNRAGGNGGALFVQSKNKTVSGCRFEDNSSSQNGGALAYDLDGNCTKNCTFKNNSASLDGGGLYIPTDQDAKVQSCTFDGNKSGVDGGGMCACAHTDAKIENSTFKNNKASGNGGGIYFGALSSSDHSLTNVTITNNHADKCGGGIYCNTGTAKAADVDVHGGIIITDNTAGGAALNIFGKILKFSTVQQNAFMKQASGKKAMFYTKSDFDSGRSSIYVTSSTDSDIAVVDLNSKAHENAFHADRGRRLYRGSFHNYTLYLDSWNGGSFFTSGNIALIAAGIVILLAGLFAVFYLKKKRKTVALAGNASETDIKNENDE